MGKVLVAKPPIIADLYVDMQAGNIDDVLTVDIFNACTYGAHGTVTIVPDPMTQISVVSGNGTYIPKKIRVGGVTYTDNGPLQWKIDHSIGGSSYVRMEFTPKYLVSTGFFVNCGQPASGWHNYDQFVHSTTPGYDGAIYLKTLPPQNYFSAELVTSGGTADGDNHILMEIGKTYWITARWWSKSSNSRFEFSLYDPDDWSLVGTSGGAIDDNLATKNVMLGVNNNAVATTGYSYWHGFVMDWTNGIYPLLPA